MEVAVVLVVVELVLVQVFVVVKVVVVVVVVVFVLVVVDVIVVVVSDACLDVRGACPKRHDNATTVTETKLRVARHLGVTTNNCWPSRATQKVRTRRPNGRSAKTGAQSMNGSTVAADSWNPHVAA